MAALALCKYWNPALDIELTADNNLPPGTMAAIDKTEAQRERLLGAYLFALCVYQIGIYCWPGGPPFILDPRAGIPVLLINHFSFDNKVIYPVEWITATWLVIAAAMIFFRGKFLRAYLIVEIVLAAPTAYYICVLADPAWRRFRAGVQGPRLDRAAVPCFFR